MNANIEYKDKIKDVTLKILIASKIEVYWNNINAKEDVSNVIDSKRKDK